MRERFDHDGMTYSVTLGWHHCEAGDSLEEALRHADLELYARKPAGAVTADEELHPIDAGAVDDAR